MGATGSCGVRRTLGLAVAAAATCRCVAALPLPAPTCGLDSRSRPVTTRSTSSRSTVPAPPATVGPVPAWIQRSHAARGAGPPLLASGRRRARLPVDHRPRRLRRPAERRPGRGAAPRDPRVVLGRAQRRAPARRVARRRGRPPPARTPGGAAPAPSSAWSTPASGPTARCSQPSPGLGRAPRGFRGECPPGARTGDADDCNRKLVAARWFVDGFGDDDLLTSSSLSPRDDSGHGTQMASIAAGNAGVTVEVAGQRPRPATAASRRRRGSPSTRRAGPRPTRLTTGARPPTS